MNTPMLLDALSSAADEITRELAPGSVEVRLRGREPQFAVTPPHPATADGASRGGVEFGPASDGQTYFVGISDIYVAKPAPGVYAFGVADGALKWSAPSEKLTCAWKNPYCTGAVSQALSAMPGVVFAGAMNGHFRAYDSATGKVVWDYDTAAAPVATVTGKTAQGGVMDGAGPTIADGAVYVSSGYQARSGTPGIVLMAFTVDGR